MPEEERRGVLGLLSRIVLVLILADLMLQWAELSIPAWYAVGPHYELIKQVWLGPYWYMFWIFQLLLGALVPLALLVWRPTSRAVTAAAGSLIAVSFLAVRMNIVLPGEITPALRGLEEAYVDDRLTFSYSACSLEWSLLVLAFTVGIGFFYLGRRLLPLVPQRSPAS
jgi:molybdopterin-containing oxidoreductase family membrane subunit